MFLMDRNDGKYLCFANELNNIAEQTICSVKLTFHSFKVNLSINKFFINCETLDGYEVVCCGNTDLDYHDYRLDSLFKDESIILKDVKVKFFKHRKKYNHVRNDLICLPRSEILDSNGSQLLTPKPRPPKNITPKSQFPVNLILRTDLSGIRIKPFSPNHISQALKSMDKAPIFSNEIDSSNEVSRCEILKKCTTALKVSSYVPNEKTNFIFINCLTSDKKEVPVVASILRHDEETKLKPGDLVKFVDAIRVKPKKNDLGLKVEKDTKIFLLARDGIRYDTPKQMLEYKIIEKKKVETKPVEKSDTKLEEGWKTDLTSCKEHGVLQTNFEEINEFRLNIYVADLLLADGKLVKLIIDKEFGHWPKHCLKAKDRVVLIAIAETYQLQEGRHIRKGDYFDVDDEVVEEVEKLKFTCPICFEEFFVEDGRICCTPFDNAENVEEIEGHNVCVDCIKGIAKAALTDTPLASGGTGVPCCVPECKNVFLMSEFGIYLDPEVHDALMLRMQHESVLAANMNDVVTCPNCSVMTCVDQGAMFYICSCGVQKCRHCPRLYDNSHYDKTCEEMDEIDKLSKIEPQLSEAIVRKCPNCHLQFVKESGCNKMTCRCKTLQCYLCRAVVTDYNHFCHCGTQNFDQPCSKCEKTCPLMGDAKEYDERRLAAIRENNGVSNSNPVKPKTNRFQEYFLRPPYDSGSDSDDDY